MTRISTKLLLSILLGSACSKKTDPVAQFRGPDRSGIFASETELLSQWPDDGPTEVFFIDSIGNGYGSPVITNDLMYFTGAPDSIAVLYCYDLHGNEIWQLQLGREWITSYPGSRSAPTLAGNLLYAGTGYGDLYCVDIKNREIEWSRSLQEDFQGILPMFGHSESPLAHGKKVFWTAGGTDYNVLALNRFTGETTWSSEGMQERSAYHPPRVITAPNGREILVTFSAYHLMGFDAASGELLWTHAQDNYPVSEHKPGIGDTHSNTVIYEEGAIWYAAGDGNCGVKLSLSPDGSSISEVWRNKGFDSFMGGIVKIGDHIYGSATAQPQLRSIDAVSGVLTDSLMIGRGVVIASDSMIYYYSQNGKMYLVAYNDGKLEEVSSFRIRKGSKEHFSHPLIHNGVLYVRHGQSIMGFNIQSENS
jgi:outer membrane protein assembly factor BamB